MKYTEILTPRTKYRTLLWGGVRKNIPSQEEINTLMNDCCKRNKEIDGKDIKNENLCPCLVNWEREDGSRFFVEVTE